MTNPVIASGELGFLKVDASKIDTQTPALFTGSFDIGLSNPLNDGGRLTLGAGRRGHVVVQTRPTRRPSRTTAWLVPSTVSTNVS